MAKARLYFDGDNTYIEKQARIYKMVDEIGDKIDNIPGVINNLSSTSETDALSAAMGKELQDQINAMSGNFHFLSSWDCTTGLPGSDPATDPYTYQSGDYYIVSNTGSTNYKPHGSSYTHGVASTAVETQAVQMNDWYVYDGSTWILQPSGGAQIVVDSSLSTTSTNPVENRVITQALNNKQNTISNLSAIESGAAAGATALQPGANITQLTNNAGYQTAGDVASAISGKQDTLTAGEGIAINNNIITNTGITCLTGGDDIEVVQGGTHGLPTGYTELEHISLFGSQYIPTGLSYASGHTYSVHQRILFETSTNNNRGSGWNAGGAIYVTGTTMGDGSLLSNLGPTGGVADISIEIGNGTSNYTIVTGGVTRISSRSNTALSDYAGMNYPLGAMSGTGGVLQSGSNMIGSVYFFEYTDGNDRGEYYPAQRDSDDALGMYDVVSGTFYPVSGTGAVAGPEAADCTTVNFTNTSGYVTINDVNVKVFNLSSASDLTTAQAAYDFGASGGVPIIRYMNETFIPQTASFTGGNAPFWAPTTFTNNNSYTVIDAKQLYLYASSGTVTQVSRYGYTSNTLSTGKNYTTPYTPEYDGSPATKKYVDSKLYVGTTTPSNPTAGQLWYDTTNSKLKVYNGSAWEEVGSGGGGGSVTWGNIGGILSNQIDLQDALDLKQDVLTAGDGIVIQEGQAVRLPSGYTEVEWIQSDGNCAIDSGILIPQMDRVEFVGNFVENAGGFKCVVGVDDQNATQALGKYGVLFGEGTDGAYYTQAAVKNNIDVYTYSSATADTNEHTFQTYYSNGYLYIAVDNTIDSVQGDRPTGVQETIGIFCRHVGATHTRSSVGSKFKMKSIKMYSGSGVVFEGVPCKRDSDDEIGLYDLTSGTFLENQKSGTFTAGPVVTFDPATIISVDDSVFTTDSVTGGTDIEIVTQAGRGLPAGYTEIEYLQSSGTQWINTGITGNVSSTRTLKSDVGVRYDTVPAADTCLLGSRTGNIRAYMVYCYMGWCLGYGAQYRRAGNITAETKYFVTTEYKENSQTFDVNGLRTMSYTDNTPFTTDLSMYLFAINEGGLAKRFQSAKVYYAKIYVNDVLEFDGVPAKRNSDNALGIYDMVTETFLTNQGSGTFTAGPVVQPGTVINFTNDSGYVTAADIPTYTAGAGIAISNNQISSTVFDLSNLTYVGFDSDTLTPSGTSDISCPAGATVAFFSWRVVYSGAVYGAGEVIVPLQASLLKTSFIGGGYAAQTYVKGAIGYNSTGNTIHYTDGGSQGGMSIEYTVYFYK